MKEERETERERDRSRIKSKLNKNGVDKTLLPNTNYCYEKKRL